MNKKACLITLLCGTLCLNVTGCGTKVYGTKAKSADTASSESVQAESAEDLTPTAVPTEINKPKTTEIATEIDEEGEVILKKSLCRWVQDPEQNDSVEGPLVVLSDHGAVIGDVEFNLNVVSYMCPVEDCYEFEMEAVPDGDGAFYSLYIVYLAPSNDQETEDFFMFLSEGEYKNGLAYGSNSKIQSLNYITEADFLKRQEEKESSTETNPSESDKKEEQDQNGHTGEPAADQKDSEDQNNHDKQEDPIDQKDSTEETDSEEEKESTEEKESKEQQDPADQDLSPQNETSESDSLVQKEG